MSECLYRLWASTTLGPGDVVFVNGPHDRFGRILSDQGKPPRVEGDPFTLFLIRGIGKSRPPGVMDHEIHDTVSYSEPSGNGAIMKSTSSYNETYCEYCGRGGKR